MDGITSDMLLEWLVSFLGELRLQKWHSEYRIYRKYLDRQAWANSVDPDEMPQNAASHQGLLCLRIVQQCLDTITGSKLYLFKF